MSQLESRRGVLARNVDDQLTPSGVESEEWRDIVDLVVDQEPEIILGGVPLHLFPGQFGNVFQLQFVHCFLHELDEGGVTTHRCGSAQRLEPRHIDASGSSEDLLSQVRARPVAKGYCAIDDLFPVQFPCPPSVLGFCQPLLLLVASVALGVLVLRPSIAAIVPVRELGQCCQVDPTQLHHHGLRVLVGTLHSHLGFVQLHSQGLDQLDVQLLVLGLRSTRGGARLVVVVVFLLVVCARIGEQQLAQAGPEPFALEEETYRYFDDISVNVLSIQAMFDHHLAIHHWLVCRAILTPPVQLGSSLPFSVPFFAPIVRQGCGACNSDGASHDSQTCLHRPLLPNDGRKAIWQQV
mmetsp:Transcript_30144/g.65145  ORF Transcript_30144/g.65145 Transcript_30144/m.65145 type:complete len:351 (-) Transcript_30144:134-1186(-)